MLCPSSKILHCKRKYPVSNVAQNTGYPDKVMHGFLHSFNTVWNITRAVSCRFLSKPFLAIYDVLTLLLTESRVFWYVAQCRLIIL
jgi:hypothetical protein